MMQLLATLLTLHALVLPGEAYKVVRSHAATHEDPAIVSKPPDDPRSLLRQAQDMQPDAVAKKYFDAALPPLIDQSELKGHRALDTVHGVALFVVFPGMTVLALVILAGSRMSLQRYTALIPESAWQVFFSAILGFFVRGLLDAGVISPHKYVWASATFLNLFLLPIIIFQSGWALNHFNFLSQLEYIGIFAVFGTLINFFFIGLVGYWFGSRGYFVVTTLRENLAFAALISAVDPVATLSTFSKLGLDSSQPLLHTMIFGESVINDAVAIVLFHTINTSWEDLTFVHCMHEIAVLLFGSAGFGILLASVLVWLLRLARLPGDTVPETAYIVASAWLVFSAAEGVGFSGIIANLCAGGIFRMYGSKHLEHEGLERTDELLETCGHIMDSLVFILCGVSTALIHSLRGLKFAVFGFVLCLVGRALSTTSCAAVCNTIKFCMQEPAAHKITAGHQFVMWHAGLRGGIALLLALELDAEWCAHKATLINATFIIICLTLVLLGSTTEPVLGVLGFGSHEQEPAGREVAESDGHGSRQLAKQPSLMDEITGTGRQRLKLALINGVHDAFTYALVGDQSRGAERRKEKHAFIETLKTGAILKQDNKMEATASTA